ncbi:hypothetical protein OSTOST_11814, partial [Ostertagia ostertagi]
MSLAIRFIGNYDVNAQGKFLWEILCQLSISVSYILTQLGVGRIVTKNEWARKWPTQPSYIKIVRAQPAMDRWLFGGKVWGEWTYRGRNLGVYEFADDLNRSDWRLIHKYVNLLARKACEKAGVPFREKHTRAPLQLCIDPEFSMLTPPE